MSPIRPNFPLPVAQPRPVRPENARGPAAFFQAAVNGAPRPPQALPPPRRRPARARGRRDCADRPGRLDPPQRYLRPGSLLDIKV